MLSVWSPAVHAGLTLDVTASHGVCNGSSLQLWEPCPDECPVHMHVFGRVCEFTCVDGSPGSCTNPAMVVVDHEMKHCRSCGIPGCQRCSPEDHCLECATGFYLVEERGVCKSKFGFLMPCLYGVVGATCVTLALWYVWLRNQPVINSRVLKRAIMRRHHLNLRDHTSSRHDWYPLTTNLCRPREDGHVIGGRALLMFFSFQAFILVWSASAGAAWLFCVSVFNSRMLTEGTVKGNEDVYTICGAAHSTLHTLAESSAQEVAEGTLAFTVFLYVFTALTTLCYAVHQRRRRVELDTREASMKDFAVMLTGFPAEEGREVERERTNFVRRATGCQPVGVSVCWAYDRAEVQELTARETWLWGKGRDSCGPMSHSTSTLGATPASGCACCLQCFFQKLNQLLAPPIQPEDAELGKARRHEERAAALARDAVSTSCMYVVFATETDRDHAKKLFSCATSVPLYMGHYPIQLELTSGGSEPESVLWQNFGRDVKAVPYKVMASIAGIAVSIMFWGLFFYFPFAAYEAWSYSALGRPADSGAEMTFSLLVVVGNQLLYLLCAIAAKKIGFRFASQELAAYTGLYTMALLSNMFIDLWILFYTTAAATENLGLEVSWSSFLLNREERVTFPLRAKLGARLYAYNFPSCFLLPFLCEALFTVIIPYHLYSKLVGSQPISQRGADACLLPSTFDMARYADVVLNMTQATVSLFFSPGYVCATFFFMFFGHLFVYAFDHYRVLRHVRQFRFSSYRTEKVAQRLLALPGASLATCVMFQLFQVHAVEPTTKAATGLALLMPALLHVAVHMLVLGYVVPWLGRTRHVPARQRYSQVAKIYPGNFFNLNPVHCLRSRYLHEDHPPCIFYQIGKEHLLEPNPKLGLYYSAPEWNNEKTSTFTELAQFARKSLGGALAMATPRFAVEPLREQSEVLSESQDDQSLKSSQTRNPLPAAGSGTVQVVPPESTAQSSSGRRTRKSMVTFASEAQPDEDPT